MNALTQQSHPTQQQLAAFVSGKLAADQSNVVEQHLAECESCCQVIQTLPDDDTLVALLRDPQADTSVSPEQPAASPIDMITIPPASEQATLPPNHSPTKTSRETSEIIYEGLPDELRRHARYEVTELLGKGGMGDVYKAHHRMMNRPVALKLINGELVQSPAAVKRFHREVQAAARLSHPNIVTAYDAEQAGDVHYLVMEYVDGVELAQVVRERGPLPVAEACEYIRQAAEGLQHAHQLGMVHRDIKPQNLMVTGLRIAECGLRNEEERKLDNQSAFRNPHSAIVKILDFGLANFATETAAQQDGETVDDTHEVRVPTHLTMMGSMMGTPDYISPEQARDAHSADIRSDIYSLGCTFYCLLTGEPPFATGSMLDKVMAHVEREPKPPSDRRADIPPALENVLRRMMAKNPDDRFQTPTEVAQALSPFTSDDRHSPAVQVASSRSPVVPLTIVATLMLGLLIALGAVIVVATARGRVVIQSQVDDVKVAVLEGGKQIEIIDLKTGSQVTRWLPLGNYELKLVGNDNDVTIDNESFQMKRLGTVIVSATWSTDGRGAIASFNPPAETITKDGIAVDDGGWKITASEDRSVRLFEVTPPMFAPGPYFYRAKVKSENVKGRAYLKMWSRFPGQGEFYSKGFDKAISGTNGWSEYEVPFYLKKGQQPDLVKLNLTIEGGGTVWIKDIELHGRTVHAVSPTQSVSPETDDSLQIGKNLVNDPSLEDSPVGKEFPLGWGNHNAVPKGSYSFELIEGGRTGQHGWRIVGDGQYITLPTNRVGIVAGKRYVGRGWVKLTGEGSAAQVRLLYFNAAGTYFGETRLDHVAPHDEWQMVSVSDEIAAHPDTHYVSLAMSVMGKGSAVFDDLELAAFSPELLVLNRWIGEWDLVQKSPTADGSAQQETNGTLRAQWMLNNTCVLGEVADRDGVVTRIWLEDYNPQSKKYRHWTFQADGTTVLTEKSWNEATSSLAASDQPLAESGRTQTVTTQFTGNDSFATRIFHRDRTRITTTASEELATRRKGSAASLKLDAAGPAEKPAELSVLNHFVGDWSLEVTSKPALWQPDGSKLTGHIQHAQWIFGGRFVMERSWNENNRHEAMTFWTFDEKVRAWLGWNFNNEGNHAQMRGQWDEDTTSLAIEVTDAPQGTTGKGVIRFVGSDTIDSNLIFRDSSGTLLMDGRWVKTRRNADERQSRTDDQRLQGKWIPESCLMRGKPLGAEQLARMAIELNGDRATFTDPHSGFQQTGRFSIDAARTPKRIDFIAPDASERMPGIFEFNGEQLKMAWCDGDYARPTNFEPADTPDHMTAVFKRVPGSVPATAPQDEPVKAFVPDESQLEAAKAAEAYLSVVDEGKFGSLRDMVSSLARPHVTREQVSQTYQKLRDTFGKATKRSLTRVQLCDEFPGLPKGRYALVQYKTDCERQKGLWESLLVNLDTDGKWRVNTYALTLEPMPFPEAKPDPAIEQKKQAALTAAQEWLKLVDAGKYAESWQASAKINRDGITQQKLVDAYNELFKPLGQLKSREHRTSEYTTQMPRAPVGEYAVIQFRTQFTNQRVIETVVLTRESDGQWRVSGYFHAEDNSVPR